MEIEFLRHYGFKPEQIRILKSAYGPELLPLQERAIREGNLFENESLVIRSPTSSGKTFLAEVLFLHQTLQGKSAVLLVPTKALANQRYRQWKDRYAKLGFRILLSTRDHPFEDEQILQGRFHLAVMIYEKMRALLARGDAFLASLGACIVDELHYIYHPDRGPDLEILLTRLREETTLQLLGLSTTVADETVVQWLNARLLVEDRRPVELKQGVLCHEQFVYREFNSGIEGVERLPLSPLEDEGEAMLEAARHFASHGETTLLFWPSRDLCYTAARKLAEQYEPESKRLLRSIEQLDPTTVRDFLTTLIPRRIAVHTSDLSVQERALVERLVEEGEIVLICATPTLAEGINFPVTNVLTTHRIYATQIDGDQKRTSSAPIPMHQDQMLNMIGRAGRLGFCQAGCGIIVTTSPADIDGLMKRYLFSPSTSRSGVLAKMKISEIILKSLIRWNGMTPVSILDFLERTLAGRTKQFSEPLDQFIDISLATLLKEKLIVKEDERYYPTPLGSLVAKNGLSSISAKRLEQYLVSYPQTECLELDFFVLVCLLPEMEQIYISVPRRETMDHRWCRLLLQKIEEDGYPPETMTRELVSQIEHLRSVHHTAFKKALLLSDWIHDSDILALEKKYGVYAGLIIRLAEEASWLLGCLAEIAAAHALEEESLRRMFVLRERTLYGLSQEAVAWASFLKRQILSRSAVLKLIRLGYTTPTLVKAEDREFLNSVVPSERIDAILKESSSPSNEDRISYDFVIELQHGRPDQMIVNGETIDLTTLQSNLIRTLRKTPGICVDYETLLSEMWEKSVGDKKQLSKQKNLIKKKMEKSLGKLPCELIETIPGHGLVLNAKVIQKQ